MAKIFTIGFSGKSPDAFMDVLNAVRVRAVWDIRLWQTSTYVPFYSGDSLACVLGTRYEYHPEFAPTSEILAGYKDGRARKNRHYNATAGSPPNTSQSKSLILRLCICNHDYSYIAYNNVCSDIKNTSFLCKHMTVPPTVHI